MHQTSRQAQPQQQLAPSSPEPMTTVIAAGAPAIASLQDALAYPEQTPQLGPVRRRALIKHHSTTRTTTSATSTTPVTASSNRSQKRAARASAKSASARKKFPRGLARFRDRLQYLEDRLRLDVNGLKQEISDLELQRSLAATRALTTRFDPSGSAAALAREYFRVFRCGFQRLPDSDSLDVRAMRMLHASSPRASSRSTALPAPLQALQRQIAVASAQQAFLDARVDPHLAFHSYIGRDVLIQQWQRYTQSHADLRMHMSTIAVAPVDDAQADDLASVCAVVHTTGRLTARVTHDTLSLVFPHVLADAALTQQLLGAAIEYPFHLELRVDASGTITAYHAEVDFVGALNGVLGCLAPVSAILHDACIRESCMIGPLDAAAASVPARDASGAPNDATGAVHRNATAPKHVQIAPVIDDSIAVLSPRDRLNETPRARAPPVASAQCSPSAKARIQFLLS